MKNTAKYIFLIMLTVAVRVSMGADSTIDPLHPYAYGANLGWIDVQGDTNNGAVIGQYFCTGYVWSANCGWICLGSGPTNGWQYGNLAADDYGVNHQGEGKLSGQAYGANIGWLTFEQTYGKPQVDLRTGVLSGYIWGANVGWIGLSNAYAHVRTECLDSGPNTDSDGLPDAWEKSHTNDLAGLYEGGDCDNDGVKDEDEYTAGTDPMDSHDVLQIVSLDKTGDTNTVTWTANSMRLYRLESTNNLVDATNQWTDVCGGMLGPTSASVYVVSVVETSATCQFYRVQAIIPLSP